MNQKNIVLRFGIIAAMIFLAAMSRLLPHPPNFTPIGAMGLFGAAYFVKKYWALLIPFLALWMSDLVLNNVIYAQYYDSFQFFGLPGVYLAFLIIIGLGVLLLKKINIGNIIKASLIASVVFFLITNFAAWKMSIATYPQDFSGLMACYAAGIPYFWSTLAGDLFFSGVLFGGFALLQNRYPSLALSK